MSDTADPMDAARDAAIVALFNFVRLLAADDLTRSGLVIAEQTRFDDAREAAGRSA